MKVVLDILQYDKNAKTCSRKQYIYTPTINVRIGIVTYMNTYIVCTYVHIYVTFFVKTQHNGVH